MDFANYTDPTLKIPVSPPGTLAKIITPGFPSTLSLNGREIPAYPATSEEFLPAETVKIVQIGASYGYFKASLPYPSAVSVRIMEALGVSWGCVFLRAILEQGGKKYRLYSYGKVISLVGTDMLEVLMENGIIRVLPVFYDELKSNAAFSVEDTCLVYRISEGNHIVIGFWKAETAPMSTDQYVGVGFFQTGSELYFIPNRLRYSKIGARPGVAVFGIQSASSSNPIPGTAGGFHIFYPSSILNEAFTKAFVGFTGMTGGIFSWPSDTELIDCKVAAGQESIISKYGGAKRLSNNFDALTRFYYTGFAELPELPTERWGFSVFETTPDFRPQVDPSYIQLLDDYLALSGTESNESFIRDRVAIKRHPDNAELCVSVINNIATIAGVSGTSQSSWPFFGIVATFNLASATRPNRATAATLLPRHDFECIVHRTIPGFALVAYKDTKEFYMVSSGSEPVSIVWPENITGIIQDLYDIGDSQDYTTYMLLEGLASSTKFHLFELDQTGPTILFTVEVPRKSGQAATHMAHFAGRYFVLYSGTEGVWEITSFSPVALEKFTLTGEGSGDVPYWSGDNPKFTINTKGEIIVSMAEGGNFRRCWIRKVAIEQEQA